MKEVIGIIILLFCFLSALWALKTSDWLTGVIVTLIFMIANRIFKY